MEQTRPTPTAFKISEYGKNKKRAGPMKMGKADDISSGLFFHFHSV